MSTPIQVFIPLLSGLCSVPSRRISCVGDLLKAIWRMKNPWENLGLRDEAKFSQLSLRSLVYPVPLEPQDTLRKRMVGSARTTGWAGAGIKDEVPSGWCDPKNVHVYLYIDQGPEMRAAETLCDKLWGKDLKVILEEIPDDDGTIWKYVPRKEIGALEMWKIGYPGKHGLLVRPEYEVAWKESDYDTAIKNEWAGIIVTGQPGIGKSLFLYYLLFRLLSEETPVALQLPSFFIVFQDDGVYRHPLTAAPHHLPMGTRALSDSNNEGKHPCSAFLGAARQKNALIIQATSPSEDRWKNWSKECGAVKFVMNHFSIEEMAALGTVCGVNVGDLRRNYEKWGPSARVCVQLARDPFEEFNHAHNVKRAAEKFVKLAPTVTNFNATEVSHILFSIRPEVQERGGRRILVAEMATDHIKAIISYAAAEAEAQERIKFYQKISTQPGFRVSAGKMFEGFVLNWLYAGLDVVPIRCFATGQPDLGIPACGEKQTTFFDIKSGLVRVKGDKPPLCLLPISKTFPTADAIVITDEFVITIQVTISDRHTVNESGFTLIKDLLPDPLKRDNWRHVFITDDDKRAVSLRNQTLCELPEDTIVYSGVFDIGQLGVTHEDMESYDEKKQVSLQSANQQCPYGTSMDVD
ncbi:hypothetical protein BJY52DRAFT_564652 [Lactarius psammicola]|nr:hypothetical protein BJY52DRAFT_564652 [Lactarius psammicola]